jgi:hypothetical protein
MQRNKYGPKWRWLAAQSAANSPSGNLAAYYDTVTKLAADVLSHKTGRRRRRTAQEAELIDAAEAIGVDVGVRETLQILVIGGVDLHHIAEMSGVPADEIRTWEGLFFDVRACRNRPAWIRSKLIRPVDGGSRLDDRAQRSQAAVAWGRRRFATTRLRSQH